LRLNPELSPSRERNDLPAATSSYVLHPYIVRQSVLVPPTRRAIYGRTIGKIHDQQCNSYKSAHVIRG